MLLATLVTFLLVLSGAASFGLVPLLAGAIAGIGALSLSAQAASAIALSILGVGGALAGLGIGAASGKLGDQEGLAGFFARHNKALKRGAATGFILATAGMITILLLLTAGVIAIPAVTSLLGLALAKAALAVGVSAAPAVVWGGVTLLSGLVGAAVNSLAAVVATKIIHFARTRFRTERKNSVSLPEPDQAEHPSPSALHIANSLPSSVNTSKEKNQGAGGLGLGVVVGIGELFITPKNSGVVSVEDNQPSVKPSKKGKEKALDEEAQRPASQNNDNKLVNPAAETEPSNGETSSPTSRPSGKDSRFFSPQPQPNDNYEGSSDTPPPEEERSAPPLGH